jgi:male-specific lethal 2
MNATNYYVSTTRLVLQAEPDSPASWQDLYTALPTLRNSLSCTVCERLLSEPYTPEVRLLPGARHKDLQETSCEHHVCKSCKGGVKKLRPTCSWCKDYSKYSENVQLRILIQVVTSVHAIGQFMMHFWPELQEAVWTD